jgi:lipopolysaccharide export system protein LptC
VCVAEEGSTVASTLTKALIYIITVIALMAAAFGVGWFLSQRRTTNRQLL